MIRSGFIFQSGLGGSSGTGAGAIKVKCATTQNGTLASDFENGDTIDGVSLVTADKILIKNQTTGSQNGVYTVNASGAPTRSTDFNSWDDEIVSAVIAVEQGTINADTLWMSTVNKGGTIGSTAITFKRIDTPGDAGPILWYPSPVLGPEPFEEEHYSGYLFQPFATTGGIEALFGNYIVPRSYSPGRQIFLDLIFYSTASSNMFEMETITALIRENTDSVFSTGNQHTANTELTNSVANAFRLVTTALTDSSGQINSVSVTPGQLLRVKLQRSNPSGTDDTTNVRFIPGMSKVRF